MISYFQPAYWRAAFGDPLTLLAITVDVIPVIFVVFFGWGAEALVLLYWAENLLIGVATLVRMFLSGLQTLGVFGLFVGTFMTVFFTFHYGLFCFGHGVFLFEFARSVDLPAGSMAPSPDTMWQMFHAVRLSWPGMGTGLMLILAYQLAAAIADYWPGKAQAIPSLQEEMFAPYGRIVVLHIGIFAGAAALIALGDPMIGVLLLIVLRIGFSIVGRSWRDSRRENIQEKTEG